MPSLFPVDSVLSNDVIDKMSVKCAEVKLMTEGKVEITNPNLPQIEGYIHSLDSSNHIIKEDLPADKKAKGKPKEIKISVSDWEKRRENLIHWVVCDDTSGGEKKPKDWMLLNFFDIKELNKFPKVKIETREVRIEKKDPKKEDSEKICYVTFRVEVEGGQNYEAELELFSLAGNEARILMLKEIVGQTFFRYKTIAEVEEEEEEAKKEEPTESKLPGYIYEVDEGGVRIITEKKEEGSKIKPKEIVVAPGDWNRQKFALKKWIASAPNSAGEIEKGSLLLEFFSVEDLKKIQDEASITVKPVVFSDVPSKKNENKKIKVCKFKFFFETKELGNTELELELPSISGNEVRILQMVEMNGEKIPRGLTIKVEQPEKSEEAKEAEKKEEEVAKKKAETATKEQEQKLKEALDVNKPEDPKTAVVREIKGQWVNLKTELKNLSDTCGEFATRVGRLFSLSTVTTPAGPGAAPMAPVEGLSNLKDSADAMKGAVSKVKNIMEILKLELLATFVPEIKAIVGVIDNVINLAEKATSLI